MTTPKHDAETSTFTRVAIAEITSNHEKSLASQTPTPLEPPKEEYKPETDPYQPEYERKDSYKSTAGRRIFPVKLDVCPYIATHLIADDQVQVPRSSVKLQTLVRKNSSNRRTPKNYANSTPVPALVPSQCDGSGGPWQ